MALSSDQWNIYHYAFGENEEFMALVSFDETAVGKENQQGYQRCIRLVFQVSDDLVYENGLIHGKANEALMLVENQLIQLLEQKQVNCRFVGRQTYYARKEFVFQVEDEHAFSHAIRDYISSLKEYRFETVVSNGWDFFNQKISPNLIARQQISDRTLIETLKENSNADKPHYFEHHFRGPKTGLQSIQKELEEEKFDLLSLTDDSLTMAKRYDLDEDVINQTSEFMILMSTHFKCSYDGWGAGTEN